MGRQTNFFLGPLDQRPFEDAIRASGDVTFLESRPASDKAKELSTSIVCEYGKDDLRVLIVRTEDVPDIRFYPIKTRTDFSCNVDSQLVVEFDRSFVASDFIRRGRLYFVASDYDENGILVEKSAEFLTWADRLLRRAKKSLVHLGQGFYAGRQALELQDKGVKLRHF